MSDTTGRQKPGHVFQCPSCGTEHDFTKIAAAADGGFSCDNPKCDLPPQFKAYGRFTDAEAERTRIRKDDATWSRPNVFQAGADRKAPWIIAHFNGRVQRFEPASLADVISRSALRGMLTGFGDEKGCTLSIIEVRGRARIEPVRIHNDIAEVLGIPPHRRTPYRNFSPLCLALRAPHGESYTADPKHPCELFDAEVVSRVIEENLQTAPEHYYCPAGLLDFAYPIRVGGKILAVLLSGQRRDDSPEGEDKIKSLLPGHATKCGLEIDRAFELLLESPRLRPDEVDTFKQKLLDVGHEFEEVAEKNTLNIRKTRDQYFMDEIAGRIRQRMPAFVTSTPKALFELLHTRIAEYIGLSHTSLLYTRSAESNAFFRQTQTITDHPASADLPATLFTNGPADRDGLISLFDSPQRTDLQRAIAAITPDLPTPLFLLRIILEAGIQLLLVFHADSIDEMPPSYAPRLDHLYMRRSFYTRLSRAVQGELDIIQRYGNQQKAMMSITHTAHQPLDAILQIESMIRTDLAPGALTDKWLKDVKHTAEHAQALCGSMARVFKCLIDQGRTIDQSPDVVDVDEVIRTIAKAFRLYERGSRAAHAQHRRGLSIRYVQKVRRFRVVAERETVLFVLYNLLHNAEKYSDLNSHIVVEYSTEHTQQDRLFIKIKSWGEPISDDARQSEKPFELFWRGTRLKTGLGVGLWASRYLLERQGRPGARGEILLLPLDTRYPRLTVFGVRFPMVQTKVVEELT